MTKQSPWYQKFSFNYPRLIALLSMHRGETDIDLMTPWFNKWTTLSPRPDISGNFHLEIPRADGTPSSTLWVAHTDTVDKKTSIEPKSLYTDQHIVWVNPELCTEAGVVLGADDGAGVEILCRLAESGIPGYYLWSADEESGCIGTQGFLNAAGEQFFGRFQRCICFDRKGTDEIITEQMGSPCCSDTFGRLVAEGLAMGHKLSPHGVFTDSAEYTHLIPECTNISCGYQGAHSKQETLDMDYLSLLTERVLTLDWEHLPSYRKPEPRFSYDSSYWKYDLPAGSGESADTKQILTVLRNHPKIVAQVIEDYGMTGELLDAVYEAILREDRRSTDDLPELWSEGDYNRY